LYLTVFESIQVHIQAVIETSNVVNLIIPFFEGGISCESHYSFFRRRNYYPMYIIKPKDDTGVKDLLARECADETCIVCIDYSTRC